MAHRVGARFGTSAPDCPSDMINGDRLHVCHNGTAAMAIWLSDGVTVIKFARGKWLVLQLFTYHF